MASYDGTSKSVNGFARNIPYFKATSPYLEGVKQRCMEKASAQAIAYLDPLNYKGPDAVDASNMTEQEWQDRRRFSIGSSSAAKVFGDSPYEGGTNLDLYNEMTGATPLQPEEVDEIRKMRLALGLPAVLSTDDEERQELFDWGHLCEEFLHKKLSRMYPESELIVDTNIYNPPGRPFLTVNLDRMMRRSDGSYVHIEFKSAHPELKPLYANNAIPLHYKRQLIQCQHTMGVWESILAVCFGGPKDVIIRKYERDLDAEMEQVRGVTEFYTNNVLRRVPPVPLGPAHNIVACMKKYAGPVDENKPMISLPNTMASDAKALHEVTTRIKSLNNEIKILEDIKNRRMIPLIQAIGDGTKAIVSDGTTAYEITYSPRIGRKTMDFDRFRMDYPDLYAQYVSQKKIGSRPMLIKEVDVRP